MNETTRFGVLATPEALGEASLPAKGSRWRYSDPVRTVMVEVREAGLGDVGEEPWVRIKIQGQRRLSVVDLVFFRRHCLPLTL